MSFLYVCVVLIIFNKLLFKPMHDRLVSRSIDALHQCFLVVICDTRHVSFWINEIMHGSVRTVKLAIVKLVCYIIPV